jgi:hypothetical protein
MMRRGLPDAALQVTVVSYEFVERRRLLILHQNPTLAPTDDAEMLREIESIAST